MCLEGKKFGCLTLINGLKVSAQEKEIRELYKHQRKEADEEIRQNEASNQHFLSQSQHQRFADNLEQDLQKAKSENGYICLCKCGHIFGLPPDLGRFSGKKFVKYCGGDCGLKTEHIRKMEDTYPREKHKSYHYDFVNTVHETLNILECVDENYEETIVDDRRKKGAGRVIVYKKYKCQCDLCGKEYIFRSSDFEIRSDSHGPNADKGYYSKAYCDCHKISSFQWRTIKLFQEYGIKYKAEYWFLDLFALCTGNPLRYDFAVFDTNEEIRYLIECQGPQHYGPLDEPDGEKKYYYQKRNDEKKREYAQSKNIPLIEIPYTCNTYEKEREFLEKQGIFNSL